MATEPTTNAANPGQASAPPAVQASPAEALETPKETEPPKEGEQDLSPRFAALAKRERHILAQKNELARQKAELEGQHREALEYKKARENAKLNPLAYLESAGLSIQEVSEYILNDRKLTPEQRVDLLEKKIQEDAEAKARLQAEASERETQAIIEGHKKSVAQFIQADPDTYELVSKHGQDGVELVFQVIYDHFVENGGRLQPMPIKDAAQAVEDYLEKQYKESILTSKKFQPKASVVAEEVPLALSPPISTQPKTLTHQALTAAPPPTQGTLSEDESKRRAAALLKWT